MPDSADDSAATRLRVAADRFVNRVGHWTAPRWARPVGGEGSGETRADRVHALVQRLADLGAEAEGRPRRPVPRLDNDLALVDQVRVMVADLLRAGAAPEALEAAAEAIASLDLD